jgi:hypothetical protein
MTDPVSIYLTVLFIGVGLTVVVGQILIRSGRPILEDVFPRPGAASSVTQLLVVLFHLVVLGIIALVASMDVTLDHPLQTIVVRIGLILLVLGIAYGSTLLVLARLRARRRQQLLTDEHNAQVERAQQAQQYGQPGAGAYPAAQTYPQAARIHPVSEPGPGR